MMNQKMNQNIKYINYLNNKVMKTTKKRNIIYLNKDGRYSLVGLNKNERESLIIEREILSKHIGERLLMSISFRYTIRRIMRYILPMKKHIAQMKGLL